MLFSKKLIQGILNHHDIIMDIDYKCVGGYKNGLDLKEMVGFHLEDVDHCWMDI